MTGRGGGGAAHLRLQTPDAFFLFSQPPEVLGYEVHPVGEAGRWPLGTRVRVSWPFPLTPRPGYTGLWGPPSRGQDCSACMWGAGLGMRHPGAPSERGEGWGSFRDPRAGRTPCALAPRSRAQCGVRRPGYGPIGLGFSSSGSGWREGATRSVVGPGGGGPEATPASCAHLRPVLRSTSSWLARSRLSSLLRKFSF